MAGIKFDARKNLTLAQLAQILTLVNAKAGMAGHAVPVSARVLARIESALSA
jgi:hypothetical protein